MPVAPVEHLLAAKAGVTAPDDAHLGPGTPQAFDQQRQNRPRMLGGVDLRGAQIRYQQLLAAEDIQRQKTVVVVVAMEEAAFLAPMDGIVGGVEVEDEFGRCLHERSDEVLEDDFVNRPGTRPVVLPVLQPAQGGARSELFVALGRCLQ